MVRRRRGRSYNDRSRREWYLRDRLYRSLFGSLRSMNDEYYSRNYHHYGAGRTRDPRYNRDYDWRLRESDREGGDDARRLRNARDERIRREREEDERIRREESLRAVNRPIKVEYVDLHIRENCQRHHTDKYELTQKERGRELVIRRGEPFIMTIILDKRYDKRIHSITVNFHLGEHPDRGDGTMKSLPINDNANMPDKPYEWHVRLQNVNDNKLNLEVLPSCTCIIGEWSLSIDTIVKSSRGDKPDRYHHPDDINILLNPWCQFDDVYFPETDKLAEYILNDEGCLFTGSAHKPSVKPWVYGQFKDGILETCFRLLRKGNGSQYTNRLSNPVEIARMITHLVNRGGEEGEEAGILIGNWSGNYAGGTRPTAWTGSVKILEEYERNNGDPVKFGQCWVFAGVTTTICRALGLPCKSVTCFDSAHDTDKSTTIDKYHIYDWKTDSYVLSEEMSADSIWNFHVWNEGFFNRPDLRSAKYNGWQVIDSTPQELSDGMYACGPCPVKAVKNGDVVPRFDGKFIFAEVNADVIHWNVEGRKRMIDRVEKSRVGKLLLTKFPDGKPYDKYLGLRPKDVGPYDVTHDYKFPEGSMEERMSVRNAGNASNENRGFRTNKMIEVNMEDIGDVMIGSDFVMKFKFRNRNNAPLELGTITVLLLAKKYTGEVANVIIKDTYNGEMIRPHSDFLFSVPVDAKRYLPLLEDQHNMEVSISTRVKETRESVTQEFEFRLRRPDLHLEFKTASARVGQRIWVTLRADMPINVTNCIVSLDGAGFDWSEIPTEYRVGTVEANNSLSGKIEVIPKRKGLQQLIAEFESDELHDITGHGEVWVE